MSVLLSAPLNDPTKRAASKNNTLLIKILSEKVNRCIVMSVDYFSYANEVLITLFSERER